MKNLVRPLHLRSLLWAAAVGLTLYVMLTRSAVSADGFTMFDPIADGVKSNSEGWYRTILGLVRPTFLILATLEICWAAAIWAFEKDSLNSLALEMIKKIMFIGFFYALLQQAPLWIPMLVQTFQTVGETAVGQSTLSTDGIIAMGLGLVGKLWAVAGTTTAPILLLPTEIGGNEIPPSYAAIEMAKLKLDLTCIVTVAVMIAYVVVAAQYFTLQIESYVLLAVGAVFLGLGSNSWTKEYVTKYLNYAINTGVRLLVMILILSITLKAANDSGPAIGLDFVPLLKVMAAAILQAILAMKAPEMAGALLSGGVGLSAGSAKAAAGGFKSAMAGTLGAAVSAVQGASNLGKAVNAGRGLAQQEGKTGAAATLSGLGAAAGQVAKQLPGSVMNAIKGKGSGSGPGGEGQGGYGPGGYGGRGQNPGPIDRAKQALRGLASDASAGSGGEGGGGAGATGLSFATAASSQTPGGGNTNTGDAGGASGSQGESALSAAARTDSNGPEAIAGSLSSPDPGNTGHTEGALPAYDPGTPPGYDVEELVASPRSPAGLAQTSLDRGRPLPPIPANSAGRGNSPPTVPRKSVTSLRKAAAPPTPEPTRD